VRRAIQENQKGRGEKNMSDNVSVAVVSGGSRGLGQAITADLLGAGWAVATFSRSPTEFVEKCRAEDPEGRRFRWEAVDGADSAAVARFVRGVAQRFERIDALVNNMATLTDGLLTMLREGDIHRQVMMNLEAPILLARSCLKVMLPQASGAIVNIASVNALRGHTGVSVYSATKAAMIGLTKSLAVEAGPAGVRVNCVAPGYFQSEMTAGMTSDQLARLARRTPLRRLGKAEDIAAVVRFLLSPQAAFVTGQTIAVDGGYSC
jgi:3-oxoacyl-[acyl-carrier protein] reductase